MKTAPIMQGPVDRKVRAYTSPCVFVAIVSAVYLVAGIIDVFVYKFAPVEALQVGYVVVLSSPLVIRPLGLRIGLPKWWS